MPIMSRPRGSILLIAMGIPINPSIDIAGNKSVIIIIRTLIKLFCTQENKQTVCPGIYIIVIYLRGC